MTVLSQGTWVLVADGEKALFLRNDLEARNPDLNVVRIETQDNPADRDQGAGRAGRKADAGPGQKTALEETDWHELAKDRFADEIANILYKQAHTGAFERIVLVAPPATLGELRNQLHPEVRAKVVAEIAKTLTNHPIDKIESLLLKELEAA